MRLSTFVTLIFVFATTPAFCQYNSGPSGSAFSSYRGAQQPISAYGTGPSQGSMPAPITPNYSDSLYSDGYSDGSVDGSQAAFDDLQQASPTAYVDFDVMFLRLSHSEATQLPFLNYGVNDPFTPRSNIAQGNQFQPVPRVTLGWRSTDDGAFEITYFGRNSWTDSVFVQGPNEAMAITQSTNLQNIEVNAFSSPPNPNSFALMYGFRYILFDEKLSRLENDVQGRYSTNTDNNLFGGQIGARWQRSYKRLTGSIIGKGGVFGNAASQRQNYSLPNVGPGLFGSVHNYRPGAAFAEEVGANLKFQVTPRFSVWGGYNFFWIQGLALPGAQDDAGVLGAVGHPHTNGSVLLYGPSLGGELRF